MRLVTNAWTSVATIEWASDSAQLTQLQKKHSALTAVTCLSRHRAGVTSTPRTRTTSATSIASFPSISCSALLGSRSMLLLVSVQSRAIPFFPYWVWGGWRGHPLADCGYTALKSRHRDLCHLFYSWDTTDTCYSITMTETSLMDT